MPGDLVQRDSRTQGWNEGNATAPGGDKARVTSGVRERPDVQLITPDRVVEMCFCCLYSSLYS